MGEGDYLPKGSMPYAGKFKPIPTDKFDEYIRRRDRLIILVDALLKKNCINGDVEELQTCINFIKEVRPKLFKNNNSRRLGNTGTLGGG